MMRASPPPVTATRKDAVVAAARLNRPFLITTRPTIKTGFALPAVDTPMASDVVWRQGSGIAPDAPGGGRTTSRLAIIPPVRTLMNCKVKSALAVPTFAAPCENCWLASTGIGGLARRNTTAIRAGDEALASASSVGRCIETGGSLHHRSIEDGSQPCRVAGSYSDLTRRGSGAWLWCSSMPEPQSSVSPYACLTSRVPTGVRGRRSSKAPARRSWSARRQTPAQT